MRHNLITSSKEGLKIDTPKTRTSTRDIPMTKKVYNILKRQQSESEGNKDDFVFYAAKGPVSCKRITHEINVILRNMEEDGIAFPYFTLHSTRRTFATRCIENGMNPQVLKTILGHATLAMTMDLYSHVLPDITQPYTYRYPERIHGKTGKNMVNVGCLHDFQFSSLFSVSRAGG